MSEAPPPWSCRADGLRVVVTSLPGAIAHALLDGSIEPRSMATFEQALDKVRAAGTRFYILDFEHVSFVSETGLGHLAALVERTASAKGRVFLVKMRKRQRDVFDILGLSEAFTFVENTEAALAICNA